ncbi:two pore domain potassium channel family protein [Chloroflexota bacterium]
MEGKERFEEVTPLLPGDKLLRIHRRRPRRRLRITPNIPGVFRFLRDIAIKTPLIPMVLALVALLLLSSWGIYLAEHRVNEQITSYGYALWWSFTAMQTQGANTPGPVTTYGIVIGVIWSTLSTVAFFGVIIGSLYAYFMLPKRQPSREIISAIQYNLEELEHLSFDELETLRNTTVRIIDAQISRLKENSQGQ